MAETKLTREQEAFLEECLLEFSDRYTDADLEYKKIFEEGVPPPPIMCPWYVRPKFNRDRGDRCNDRRDRGDRFNDHRDRFNDRRDHYHDQNSHHSRDRNRFRPY